MTAEQAKGQVAPLSGAGLWLAAVMLAMANFVAVLDMTIANVSMPISPADLASAPARALG